jgi:murein hydrolase activator
MLCMISSLAVFAQPVDELRRKKQQAAEEIRLSNDLLTKVSASQKTTLNRLQLLNRQINQRNELISTMSSEVSLLQQVIDDNTWVVGRLTADLEDIRQEYARMVQVAYKNRMAYDKVLFFLSAENFNQAYRRLLYLRQYTSHRKRQLETIASLQSLLWKKVVDIENQKRTRQEVLNEQKNESSKLESEKRQQSTLSQQLQKQQNELRNKIASSAASSSSWNRKSNALLKRRPEKPVPLHRRDSH